MSGADNSHVDITHPEKNNPFNAFFLQQWVVDQPGYYDSMASSLNELNVIIQQVLHHVVDRHCTRDNPLLKPRPTGECAVWTGFLFFWPTVK